ncbi:MAG: HAMP domain-containing sensor histidine kinase [Cyclobacteriaceae bacterium]
MVSCSVGRAQQQEVERLRNELSQQDSASSAYAHTLLKICATYIEHNPDSALQYCKLSLAVPHDNDSLRAQTYLNLGETYLAMREFKKGLEATHMALSISKRYSYRLDELYAIDLLGKIHAGLQRYDSAYFYKTKYGSLKDSLFDIERENIRSELQTRYETEKKEQQIVQLQQDSIIKDLQVREEKQWRNNLIMLAGFLGIIAVLFYSRFRTKKRATDMLNQKNEELKELNGFKDKLFTVISHDLKSPLSAFSNLTRSLADNVKHLKQEEIEEYLRNLNVSSMDLTRLLNNLLEWALTQTGSISYNPAVIRCDELVEEVITQLRPSLQEKKIVLNNFVPEKTEAFADKNMIVIVLRNLLSNAIKFSNVGGVITIFAGRKDNLVTLGVKDEGIGISMEDQAKLFKASGEVYTVGNSNAKGTGIGLMLCRELVERNGGNIYVESKLGDSSNFYFSLPVTNLAK